MIKLTTAIYPIGIQEYEIPYLPPIVIGCKFPLNSKSQTLFVLSELDYAEVRVDLDDLLYSPPDPPGKAANQAELLRLCLEALAGPGKIRRSRGEFFPGMLALEPSESDKLLDRLVQEQAEKLSGVWAADLVDRELHLRAFRAAYREQEGGAPSGGFFMHHHPDCQIRPVAVKLKPELYDDGYGLILEKMISAEYCFRPGPDHLLAFLVHNGLALMFARPSGETAVQLGVDDIGLELPDMMIYPNAGDLVKALVEHGRRVYPRGLETT